MIENGTLTYWVLLTFAGAACGFLNTLASSGSAVSLPILMILGMPPGVANATNRLPVLFGSVMATITFWRQGQIDWAGAGKLGLSASLGVVVGTYSAEMIPSREMGYLVTGAILLALILLFTKTKTALLRAVTHPPRINSNAVILTFAVGIWLGLIVLDGATYLLLVLILVCSYALPEANAIKSFVIAVTTLISVVMFSSAGLMLWAEGITLSVGALLGGHLGARFSGHPGAGKWAFRLLVAAISLELIHLGWRYWTTGL
jgi:uncharacterized membrane protein YfcA